MEISKARARVIQFTGTFLSLLFFYLALWVLHKEIHNNHIQEVLMYLQGIPLRQFWLAAGCAALSYLALTGYDRLGLWHSGHFIPYRRSALTSFISYTLSHNIGMAPLTGGGVRYRFYSRWGLSGNEILNLLLICGSTYWVGSLTMGAIFFFLDPPDLPAAVRLPFSSVFAIGVTCLSLATLYLVAAVFIRKPLSLGKWKIPMPSAQVVLAQMAVGCLDWCCSGATLYLLLPSSSLSYTSFISIYLLAQVLATVSQVPGGLGILETTFVVLLSPVLPAPSVLGAVLAFRLVYFFIPFVLGISAFSAYEVTHNKEGFKRALQIFNRWMPDLAPHGFAALTFLAGAVLLFFNATPEVSRRILWLNEFIPLGLLESSHFIAGLLGALLLVLARGLQQRLDVAYALSLVCLGLGVLASLFKGFDYGQALLLLALFGVLLPCRRYFPKKSSLFYQRYPPLWVTAILFVWLGSIWTGVFNYRYEDYSNDLWTTFDLVEDAARFLRSTLGATVTLVLYAIVGLLSPDQPETQVPSPIELDKIQRLVKSSPRTYPALALLDDKAMLLNKKGDAFLMYGIEGKSWVSLGDPVGHPRDQEELAQKFIAQCRRQKAWPVFYQVGQDHLQPYLDQGLTVLKIGEEALIDLPDFQWEKIASSELKASYQRFQNKDEFDFEVLPPGAAVPLLPELKRLSEEWLSKNKTRERGFSTGFFDERYLRRLPLVVVRREEKLSAFAVLWESHDKAEMAVDLLRSGADAGGALEDCLLIECMRYGQYKGFKKFNLGAAPLLNMEDGPLSSFKDKLARLFAPYAEGEKLARARAEMEKFTPEWRPLYLAAPGELPVGQALSTVESLQSRGMRTVFEA
ncbi:MAG TPA: bifunctional lysylphosphatidylglycerol flippase/synthetase MprF [bacterium]|nr:bifunctional lysylphosphatidylglycerol flippase/synthetase MprF [bacterium]